MSGFNDGPLTGAPVNFPKTSDKGECCPPELAQLTYGVDGGNAGAAFEISGLKLSDLTSIEFRKTQNTINLPTFLDATLTEPGPDSLDRLRIGADTTGVGDDEFAVVVTNECGCCAIAAITVQLVP